MEEFNVDSLLIQASQSYENCLTSQQDLPIEEDAGTSSLSQLGWSRSQSSGRFAKPVTEEDILQNIQSAIPSNTRRSTTWGVKIWDSWVDYRRSLGTEIPPSLEEITNDELNQWLSRFVMEVRNKSGQPYVGGTLYAICAALQRS